MRPEAPLQSFPYATQAYMAGHMDGEEGLPATDDDPDYMRGWYDAGGGDVRPALDPAEARDQRRRWDEWDRDRGWPQPPRRPADGKYRVLMVCTGNTSRSALAEAVAKVSRPPWLLVASAGTYAFEGTPASAKSSAAALGMGLDLSRHRSSELAPGPLAAADEVWCMTRRHMDEVLAAAPWAGPRLRLLDPAGDIADPHGGDAARYRATAERVARAVRRRVAGLRRPKAEAEGGRAARRAALRIAFRVSARWWSREMLDHKVGRLDLNPDDSRKFRALCDRFLADHDWDYLHDMCYWAASFLGAACRELGIPLRVATGRYSPEGDGFDHAWLEDASGTPFDIVAVAHAEHRRKTREGGVVGEAHVCPVCDRPSMDETQEALADAPGCDCEDPPEPVRRKRRFADEDEAMSAGYEVVERGGFPEWVPEFVEPGRYSRDQEDEGSSEEAAYQLGFGPEEEENARDMAREVAAICSAPARNARGRRTAPDHGPAFRVWQAEARRAIRGAFSGVGEDDESDWRARVKSALAETLPRAMHRGFSMQATDEGEARSLAEAEIAGTRRAVPHSFSKAVARSFAVGVEPWWAAAGSVSSEGKKHRGKAGQWGAVASVEVTPDMVDWGCLDSGNSMFGDAVYDHLPFGEPVGDAVARLLIDAGGTHNAEWDLEIQPYPPGSASIEVFRIVPSSAGEMEGFWKSELGAEKSAARDTLERWNTCGRCGADLSVAGRAGDDERPLCRSCWDRLSRPVLSPPPPRRWWRWRPAAGVRATSLGATRR